MYNPSFRTIALIAATILCLSLMGFSQRIEATEVYGGQGGDSFSDTQMPDGAREFEAVISSGEFMDSIQLVYMLPDGRTQSTPRRGGSGGERRVFRFDSDEYLMGISGRYGNYIDSLRIHTNKRTSSIYGGSGGNRDYRIDIPPGNHAIGFKGRAGDYLDAIGLIYVPLMMQGV